jgi:hypothetical protein
MDIIDKLDHRSGIIIRLIIIIAMIESYFSLDSQHLLDYEFYNMRYIKL